MSQQLAGLLDVLRDTASYRQLLSELSQSQSRADFNVVRSARPFLASGACERLARSADLPYIRCAPCLQRQRAIAHLAREPFSAASLCRTFGALLRPGTMGS